MRIKLLGLSGSKNINLIVSATQKLNIEELKSFASTTNLSKTELERLFILKGLSKAEAEQATNTVLSTRATQQATIANNGLINSSDKLKNVIKGLGSAIQAHPIMTAVAVITSAIAIINAIKQASEEANREIAQNAEKAADSAKQLKDSLDGLKDYQTKIDNLVEAINSDSISQADAVEKRKELLTVQEELIKKYGHEEEVVKSITDALNGEANALNRVGKAASKDWLDKNRQDVEQAQDFLNENVSFTIERDTTTNTKSKLGWYSYKKEDFDKYADGGRRGFDSWEDYLLEPNTQIHQWVEQNDGVEFGGAKDNIVFSGTRDEILESYKLFKTHIEDFVEENYDKLSEARRNIYQELLTDISNSINYIENGANGDNRYNNSKEIVQNAAKFAVSSDDKLSGLYQAYQDRQAEYIEAESSGNQSLINQAYENVTNAYKNLLNSVDRDIGNVNQATIQEWVQGLQEDFNATANDTPFIIGFKAELNNGESLANQITESIKKQNLTKEGLLNLVLTGEQNPDSLSDDESGLLKSINEYVDGYNDAAESTGAAEMSAKSFIDVLQKLNIVQTEVAEQSTETSFGLSDEQRESLKAVYTDYDKLNKAYQDLRQEKLTSTDVAELTKAFPDLLKYVDWTDEKFGNLAEGIDEVIKERPKDLINQLQLLLNDPNMSEDGKKAIQSIITALQTLKPELKDTTTLIERIQKAIKGVSGSISTLVGFAKEIKEDGALSLSSIDTIMSDDTYQSLRPYINDVEGMKTAIEELTNKQKDAYEDLYNAQMYEQDAEAYHKAVEKKQQADENLFKDSVQRIQDEIKYFSDAYGIDVTNWDNLTDTKKAILQNTNAELLSKQNKLINQFSEGYGIDLKNFKNTTKAKADILKKFNESKVYAQINDLIDSDPKSTYSFDKNTGKLIGRYASPETQQKINAILESSGLTYADYANYRDKGQFTAQGNKALQETLDSLVDNVVKAYSINDTDWEKMTANIKSKGGSTSASSSKNYLDWIERRLKKFAQTTKEVFAKVADYISFSGKNSQLSKAITAVRNQISAYESAYQSYMNQANKLGLDSEWVTFIQNGGSGITDMSKYSEEFREKVSRYQELYDKAIDCKNAIADLKKTETEYATQMLNNIDKYYSNRINYANASVDYYNSLDTDNQFINKNYGGIRKGYNDQIAYTQSKATQLLNTLNSLVASGSIKYQSDEWYEWWDKIQKCNVEVRNLKKNIHGLAGEELQNIQSYWNNRITNLDNTISYINALSGDSTRKDTKNYSGLSDAYTSQISFINKEVSKLQNRLDSAIEAGDIEKYSKTWYEWTSTIEQAKQKIKELQTNIHQLAVDQFNDIQTKYDRLIKTNENIQKDYENRNKEIEARGYLANTKYYSMLQSTQQSKISTLTKQATALENALNAAVESGNIQNGSEEWYKMRDSIESVNQEIDEGRIKLLEYRKTITEIGWQVFNFLQDRISQLTTESDFLIDTLSESKLFDDKGNINSKGKSVMGLHTQNYEVYKEQAKQYAAEIRKINKQIENDSNNTNLIKRREELLSLQQKSISAAQKEKKAIVDLTKNGFEEQFKSLKKLIDTYTKNLDANKTLYDYQKNLNDKTSNIAKLQKQLSAYSGDGSEETMAKIQQLQVELKDAQKDLQETEYEKFISDTKSLLDDLYNDYEETINKRLDDVNALMNDTIVAVNQSSSEISNAIKSSAAEIGYALSDAVKNVWDGKGLINDRVVSALDSISTNVASMANAGATVGTYKKYATGGLVDYTGIARVDGTPSKPELVLNANDTQNFVNLRDTLRQMASKPLTMANSLGAVGFLGNTITPNILDMSQRFKDLAINDVIQNVNVHNENHIEIGIDKVEDYNDFISKMQQDRKFENIIQDMTFGRMNGKSSFAKYRH